MLLITHSQVGKKTNCNPKTKGGLVGFTLNPSAVHCSLLSQFERAAISNKYKNKNVVCAVITTVMNMINPFILEQESLMSLTRGFLLDNDIADNLLRSEEIGEDYFIQFTCDSLLSEKPDIFVTLKKNEVKTFASTKRSVKDSNGKEVNLKMNRDLFTWLLSVLKNRDIDMEYVISYSLGIYPLSLATTSGTLVKTVKSKPLDILCGRTTFCFNLLLCKRQKIVSLSEILCRRHFFNHMQ